MKRYWLAYLAAAFVLGFVYWLMPYRFTPTGAIQAGIPVKARLLLAESFPGGQAVLVERADAGHELFMVRRIGPCYRVMSGATLWPPLNGDQLSSTVNVMNTGSTSNAAVAFGGMITAENVARITAGGLERNVQHQRYYLFVWASADRDVWRDAKGYDVTGAVRYELHGLQWKATLP